MSQKVRVLQLGSPTEIYGAERWILALIKHLDPAKIEIWVASVKDEPNLNVPLCIEADKLDFPTHIFECFGRINFAVIRQLKKFIEENGINILHTHGYKTDFLGVLATKGTPCKILSTPHGWSKHQGFKNWCYEIFDRCLLPFFDAVVPLSRDLYNPLRLIPGLKNKLFLIRNGIDLSELEHVTEIDEELVWWKKSRNYVIGYVGQLIPRKGLDILLKAVGNLKDIRWKLAIVGSGTQKAELESLARQLGISDRVVFFGYRTDRISLLRGFDIFVLPSRLEGIPRCLMEAMAVGVPVVASDISGCRYLVDGKTTGMLFQTDQPKQLADSIIKVWSDDKLRDKLSQGGRNLIHNLFSAERMTKEYEDLFFNLYKYSQDYLTSSSKPGIKQ